MQGGYDLWLTDVARSAASRFTFDPASDFSPVWSSDGTQVVFRSINRTGFGPSDLFVKPANGSADERPLLATPEGKTALDWSRDGRFIELLGTYHPTTKVLKLDAECYGKWLKVGAKPSGTLAAVIRRVRRRCVPCRSARRWPLSRPDNRQPLRRKRRRW